MVAFHLERGMSALYGAHSHSHSPLNTSPPPPPHHTHTHTHAQIQADIDQAERNMVSELQTSFDLGLKLSTAVLDVSAAVDTAQQQVCGEGTQGSVWSVECGHMEGGERMSSAVSASAIQLCR